MHNLQKKWKELNRGWMGVLLYSLFGVVAAVLLNFGLSVVLSTGLPVVTISSESMVPTMNVGDLGFVYGSGDYKPGEVIVFDGWESRPIIHRVVAVTDGVSVERYYTFKEMSDSDITRLYTGETTYITKGDHNPQCDQCRGAPATRQSQIHGETLLVIPWLGWIKLIFVDHILKSPLNTLVFIVLALGAYKLYEGIKRN